MYFALKRGIILSLGIDSITAAFSTAASLPRARRVCNRLTGLMARIGTQEARKPSKIARTEGLRGVCWGSGLSTCLVRALWLRLLCDLDQVSAAVMPITQGCTLG